jgi:hypothetical protein
MLTALLVGCVAGESSDSPATTVSSVIPPSTLPCGEASASTAELGSPYRGGPTAEFTTSGGTIFVTARRFEHGGVLDPQQGVTAIYVGRSATRPSWDQQRNTVSNSIATLTVREGDYGKVSVSSGRYWLWTSTGGDILIVSCRRDGVSDPHPA